MSPAEVRRQGWLIGQARALAARSRPEWDGVSPLEEHEQAVQQFVWEWKGGASYLLGQLCDEIERLAARVTQLEGEQ
jgi:hypothetical protein